MNANPRLNLESAVPIAPRGEPSKSLDLALRPPDFTVWQVMDSAFPTGGFAHSAGLEAAWQQGEVRNADELESYVESSLHHVSHASLPFVSATHGDPDRFDEHDRLCEAFTTNHVANRASRSQGRAFLMVIERVFDPANGRPQPVHAHFAPVFGACLRRLDVSLATSLRMFLFNHLRGLVAAAVRLNIVGPIEAQALQLALGPRAEKMAAQARTLILDDIAQTAPLIDLWQGTHDRLYSRLFQS